MTSYDIKDQRNITVATCILHNFIRKHDKEDEEFEWNEYNLDNSGSNISEEGSSNQANVENIHDKEMKSIHDQIVWSIMGCIQYFCYFYFGQILMFWLRAFLFYFIIIIIDGSKY